KLRLGHARLAIASILRRPAQRSRPLRSQGHSPLSQTLSGRWIVRKAAQAVFFRFAKFVFAAPVPHSYDEKDDADSRDGERRQPQGGVSGRKRRPQEHEFAVAVLQEGLDLAVGSARRDLV